MSTAPARKKGPLEELSSPGVVDAADLRQRRQQLIKEIEEIRKRPLLVYATTHYQLPNASAYLNDEDIPPISEILDSFEGDKVDVLLETPGGLAETAIKIVRLLRPRFDKVGFIVPHQAMSAGTILAMSADELLLDNRSSLGPIDPQFPGLDGRLRPAQAIIAGLEDIKQQAAGGSLNPAYVPILRNIDPGLLQQARNASDLSSSLVAEWLARYKFRDWTTHSSSGRPVTDEERVERADEIAKKLCDHGKWLSHGSPIGISDLQKLRLEVTDYGRLPELKERIWALWVNLHLFLSSSTIYKIFEGAEIQLWKTVAQIVPAPAGGTPAPGGARSGTAKVNVVCNRCSAETSLFATWGPGPHPEPPQGAMPFPASCKFKCRNCGTELDVTPIKTMLEARCKTRLN